jgi:MFS family permease
LLALLAATGLTSIGSAMTFIAIPLYVLATTGSGTQTGLVAAAEAVGLLASSGLAGPLVDRHGAQQMSALSDLGTAVALAAIPAAHALDVGSLPVLVAVALSIGLCRGPARSAKQVLLPKTIKLAGTSVERGAGAQECMFHIGDLFGAPLGGLLIALLGPTPVLLIDAATVLTATALVWVLVPGAEPGSGKLSQPGRDGLRRYLNELTDAVGLIRADRLLFAATGLATVMNALYIAWFAVLLPGYGALVWHDSQLVGLAMAAIAAGALLGAVIYGWIGARISRWALLTGGFLLSAPTTYFILAADPHPAVLLLLLGLTGIASGPLNPVFAAVKFARVPHSHRGRVFGAIAALAQVAMPVGTLAAGILLDLLGLTTAVLVLGVAALVITVQPLIFPLWREFDAPDLYTLDGEPTASGPAQTACPEPHPGGR